MNNNQEIKPEPAERRLHCIAQDTVTELREQFDRMKAESCDRHAEQDMKLKWIGYGVALSTALGIIKIGIELI